MDIGSNAFRLAIAEFSSPTRYRILEKVRIPVRLGDSVFHTHRIDPTTMDAALEAFRSFRRTMESHGVVVHRAVATSAPREAKNRAAFIERVHTETGIDLELIQGAEEARIVALGVRAKIALARGLSVILDVGGGSSEIALVSHGELSSCVRVAQTTSPLASVSSLGGCPPFGSVVVSAKMTVLASSPLAPCTVITRTSSRAISMSRRTSLFAARSQARKPCKEAVSRAS